MRERHVHAFRVEPDEHKLPLNVRVNIVFKGVFDVRGYNLGRISAALFYKPESGGAIPCGAFARAALVCVCVCVCVCVLVLFATMRHRSRCFAEVPFV